MGTIIGIVAAVISSVLSAFILNKMNKEQKEKEKREKNRIEESRLQLEMINASIDLEKIIAKKVQHQETNGDVEAANKVVKEAQQAYYKFINRIAIEDINGE